MARRRYLIIGDGAAGTTAAQYIRSGDPSGTIAIYSDDPHPAYFRAALTNYLLGELREDQIWAVPPTFYGEMQINRVLARVAGVDTARSQLFLTSGDVETYDALLVASGARSRPPSFPGADLPGIMTMRTLMDVRRVLDLIKLYGLRRAVVVGGGPLGLEWALGLKARGVHVTIVMREARFLPNALDNVASDLLLARLRQAGVETRVSQEISAAMPGQDGRVGAVMTKAGETLPCELVAVAIGVICNTEFLQGQVLLGKTGGVIVDDRLRASAKNVFAAGDVAERGGKLLQLWEPARRQGRAVASNMTGTDTVYAPGAHYFATRLYDLDFASIGSIGGSSPTQPREELVDYPKRTGHISYKKLVIENDRLVFALMLGEREEKVRERGKIYKRLIDEKVPLGAIKGQLFDKSFDLNGWLSTNVLTEKPSSVNGASGASVAVQGKMRGTHVLSLSALAPPPAPARASGAEAAALPSQAKMKGTRMLQAPPPVRMTPATAPAHKTMQSSAVGLTMGLPPQAQPAVTASPANAARASLESANQTWELTGTIMSIGRDPQGAVPLMDPGVSHVHAQITRYGADLYLRDLGSRNGTWVNGAAVVVPHRLRTGDRIRLATTELVFRTDADGGARAPEPAPSMRMSETPRPHLEVRSGSSLGLSFALTHSPVTLGRDPTANVRLDDYSVSWRHALFKEHGGRWFVSDLNSGLGTWLNGKRLPPSVDTLLDEGVEVRLGDAAVVFATRSLRAAGLRSPDSMLPPEPHSPARAPARVTARGPLGTSPTTPLGDVTVIGSRPGACHFLVPDPTIGPQHVELSRRPDGYYARDLGSPSGTFRHGQPLRAPTKLAHGDVLMLGQHVTITFEEGP